MNRVLTMGTFDTLHPGHLYLFEQCKRIAGEGGKVTVTVNTDAFVAKYKGRPPIQSEDDRMAMVAAVRHVDEVYFLNQQDAKPAIEAIHPDFIVIGMDWAPPKDYYGQLMVTPSWLYELGIGLIYLDRLGDHSSTNLKARIREA